MRRRELLGKKTVKRDAWAEHRQQPENPTWSESPRGGGESTTHGEVLSGERHCGVPGNAGGTGEIPRSMNRRGCVVHVLACRATFNHGRWCRNNFYDNKIRLAEYLSRRNLIRQEAVSILGNVFWRRSSGGRQTAGGVGNQRHGPQGKHRIPFCGKPRGMNRKRLEMPRGKLERCTGRRSLGRQSPTGERMPRLAVSVPGASLVWFGQMNDPAASGARRIRVRLREGLGAVLAARSGNVEGAKQIESRHGPPRHIRAAAWR